MPRIIPIVLLMLVTTSNLAWGAGMAELSEAELADVWGQSLLSVEKIQGDGAALGDSDKTFTRINLNIEAEINANIDLIELGHYSIPCHTGGENGTANRHCLNQDIRFEGVSLGCVEGTDCDGGPHNFEIERPYIEFAYKGDGTANKDLIGMRIGFRRLNGWMGGTIFALSGDVYGEGEILGIPGRGESHAPRSDKIEVYDYSGTYLGEWDLTLLNRLLINNSRNTYFGIQKEDINYPRIGSGPQEVARPGFWVNLQDGVIVNGNDILTGVRMDNCWGGGEQPPCPFN